VIEAVAVAVVLFAISVWVQRLLAAPADDPGDGGRDWT
jgi:hypothetical protein